MKFSTVPSQLFNFGALPGAGAQQGLRTFNCINAETITVYILYQCNGAVANGAPTLNIRWTFRATAWDPTGGQAEGVIITAGSLAVEDWPFITPGIAGAFWVRAVEIIVPAGAQSFDGRIRETGTPATPGNAAVMAVAEM